MHRIPEGRVTPTFASSPASAAWGLFLAVPNLLIAENRDHVAGPDHVAFPHANFENTRPVVFAATAESSPSIRALRTSMLAGTAGAARNIFQMKHAPAAVTNSKIIATAILLPVIFLGAGGTGAALSNATLGFPGGGGLVRATPWARH
jgi:hypothetical protein